MSIPQRSCPNSRRGAGQREGHSLRDLLRAQAVQQGGFLQLFRPLPSHLPHERRRNLHASVEERKSRQQLEPIVGANQNSHRADMQWRYRATATH